MTVKSIECIPLEDYQLVTVKFLVYINIYLILDRISYISSSIHTCSYCKIIFLKSSRTHVASLLAVFELIFDDVEFSIDPYTIRDISI